MKDVLIYVACPISRGDLNGNVKRAHEVGLALLRAGVPCFVPVGSVFWGNATLSLPPLAGFIPEILPTGTTHADWYAMDLVILGRCDAVLRLDGGSRGADMEVAHARMLGIPVFHSVDEVLAAVKNGAVPTR